MDDILCIELKAEAHIMRTFSLAQKYSPYQPRWTFEWRVQVQLSQGVNIEGLYQVHQSPGNLVEKSSVNAAASLGGSESES